MSATKSLDCVAGFSLLLSKNHMFWIGILTISKAIGSSWSRSSDSIAMLATLTERLTTFLPGMIDVKCKKEVMNLWWMNGELWILYYAFVTNSVSRLVANLRITFFYVVVICDLGKLVSHFKQYYARLAYS